MSDKNNSEPKIHNKDIKETDPLITHNKDNEVYGRFKVKSYNSTSNNPPRKKTEAEKDLEQIFMID